jgi:hypothetical protein
MSEIVIDLTDNGLMVKNVLSYETFSEIPPGKACKFRVGKDDVITIQNNTTTNKCD